jgi:hypothetical protein
MGVQLLTQPLEIFNMLCSFILCLIVLSRVVGAADDKTPGKAQATLTSSTSSGWQSVVTAFPDHDLLRRVANNFNSACVCIGTKFLTCPTSKYCAYDNTNMAIACCSVNAQGSFVSNCAIPTKCLNQAESLVSCAADGCGSRTAIW